MVLRKPSLKVKAGMKKKLIVSGAMTLMIIGAIMVILRHIQPGQNVSERPDSRVTTGKAEGSSSRPLSSVEQPASTQSTDDLADGLRGTPSESMQSERGERFGAEDVGDAIEWLNSLEANSGAEATTDGETPAEILKKYLEVTNSPEFRAELRDILITSRRDQLTHLKMIEELASKEKELESDLVNASVEDRSSIRDELRKVRDELWESKIDLRKEVILQEDDVYTLHLRHFTMDEIRIAHEEFRKTLPPPPFLGVGEGDPEEAAKVKIEAMERLKAGGWVPAMPDDAY